ncbi:MAG: hypothetical protein JSS09_08600, partial [Verrucomicrobia bacterium]|nr:hypothetical protein [Verrucomicrobiota bacterium]
MFFSSHSKSIFLTSLACFSLLYQSNIWSTCNGFGMANSDNSCVCCGDTYTVNYSYMGMNAGDIHTSSCPIGTCGSNFTVYTLSLSPDSSGNTPELNVNTSNTTTGTYVQFDWSDSSSNPGAPGAMYITNNTSNNYTVASQLSVINASSSSGASINFTGNGSGGTISLTNASNSFLTSGDSISGYINNVTLAVPSTAFASLNSLSELTFQNSGAIFSSIGGGTLDLDMVVSGGGGIIGGSTSATPLILSGQITFSEVCTLNVASGYVNMTNLNADPAAGYVTVSTGGVLQVFTTADLHETTIWLNGGTIQSVGGDFNTSDTNLLLVFPSNSFFDMNGYDNTFTGNISSTGGNLFFEDNAGGGSIAFDTVVWPTGSTTITLASGTMEAPNSSPISCIFQMSGGVLNMTGGSPFSNAPGFFGGTVNVTGNSSINLYYSDSTNSTANVIISPLTTLVVLSQATSEPNGSYLVGNYSGTGALSFQIGDSNTGNLLGTITGSLDITVPNGFTLNSKGFSATGSLQLIEGGTYNLSNSSDVLTLVTGSSPSSIQGSITGSGSIVIEGTTLFGNGSNPITNTFSGGLTLSSGGNLEIYSTASLSTGTITGSGGDLTSELSITASISNPWQFTGGTTTTFISSTGITLTGSITTVGSGTAGISVSDIGDLTVTPSSLTIIEGTSFATNGAPSTFITTPSISGSGGLILGGSGHTVDTLTITGISNYSGNITDSSTNNGSGAVKIEADVTFSGTNTFSSGLYLVSGSLTVSAPTGGSNINVGTGTIYGQGGGITISPGTGNSTSISNDWEFLDNTTTTFTVNNGNLGLTGDISLSNSNGTAGIYIEGGGVLTITEAADFSSSGGTYEITIVSTGINKTSVSIDTTSGSTVSSHFIH